MVTASSGDFRTHAEWFRSVITEDVVLCGTSSLEMQDMFNGQIDEHIIDVYALKKGKYDNINYNIVSSFNGIDIVFVHGVRCTTVQQTINDMLRNFYNTDEWALTEALAIYYCTHGDSFEGLQIAEENRTAFKAVEKNAIDYYTGG